MYMADLIEDILHNHHVLYQLLASLFVVVADRVHPQDLAKHAR